MEGLIPESQADGPANPSVYRGETASGVRHGNGTYVYPMGGQEMFVYDGNWERGSKSGNGLLSIKGTSKYEGAFDSTGEITGYGKRTWDDGRIYEGNWVNGEQSGLGTWSHIGTDRLGYAVNQRYEGEFVGNRRQGQGIYNDGETVYKGPFAAHKFNGQGVATAKDSSFTLEGTFVDNVVTGAAQVTYADNEAEGDNTGSNTVVSSLRCDTWKGGRPTGDGSYVCTDGSYNFRGKFDGNGRVQDTDVASYLWGEVDRKALVAAEEAEAEAKLVTAGGKPGKKAAPKKGEVEALTVPRGRGLGAVTIRAGGQALLDQQAADAAAAAADPKAKKGKDAPVEGQPLPPPVPPAGMPIPCERRRRLKLELRKEVTLKEGAEEGQVGSVKLSDPLPLWVRNDTQDDVASAVTRFPTSAVVYCSSAESRARAVAYDLGAPTALALEGGAAEAAADTAGSGVVCNVLPVDGALSYDVSFDNWTGATERNTYFSDYKIDHKSIISSYRERTAKSAEDASAAHAAAVERAEALDAQRVAEAAASAAAASEESGETIEAEALEPTVVPPLLVVDAWEGSEEIPLLTLSRQLNGDAITSSSLALVLSVPRTVFKPSPVEVEVAAPDADADADAAAEPVETPAEVLSSSWSGCTYELRLRSTAAAASTEEGSSEEGNTTTAGPTESSTVCASWPTASAGTADVFRALEWHAIALDIHTDGLRLASDGVELSMSSSAESVGLAQAWLPDAPREPEPAVPAGDGVDGGADEEKASEPKPELEVIQRIVRFGGRGFAGAVKTLALSVEPSDILKATDIFSSWRAKDATWAAYKIHDWYERSATIAAMELAVTAAKEADLADAEVSFKEAQEEAARATAALEVLGAPDEVPIPTPAEGEEPMSAEDALTAAKEAATSASETAVAAVTTAEASLATAKQEVETPVTNVTVPDVPYDCQVNMCAWTTLVCGSADFSHVFVPVDAEPGNYVLTVTDAATAACQLTAEELAAAQADKEEKAKAAAAAAAEEAGEEKDDASAAQDSSVNAFLTPVPLASVKGMRRMIKPLPIYADISFLVVDPKADAVA